MKRKVLSLILAFMLILTMLPMNTFAGSVENCNPEGGSCTHQAAIGTTHYDTLEEAIAAANANASADIITLLTDLDNTNYDPSAARRINLPAGDTLDGNQKTISGNIKIYVAPAGGTVKNVIFNKIHDSAVKSQSDITRYGFTNTIGTASAVIISNLTGTATIEGCTFNTVDWDAIQVVPKANSTLNIKNNIFKNDDASVEQLRYIHVETTSGGFLGLNVNLNVTDNQFYKQAGTYNTCHLGVWRLKSTNVSLAGNYFEALKDANGALSFVEIDKISYAKLYPMRSQASADIDDLTIAAVNKNKVYDTVQAAIDDSIDKGVYIELTKDCAEDLNISNGPLNKTDINIKGNEYILTGNIVNNAKLSIYTGTKAHTATITNNDRLVLKNDTAIKLKVINNGKLSIISGKVYDLSNITNNAQGKILISGGSFTTEPNPEYLAEWHKVTQNPDGSYIVKKMTYTEAVAAGCVATSMRKGGNYFKTLQEAANKLVTSYLQKDNTESLDLTNITQSKYIRLNNFSYKGSVISNKNDKTIYFYEGASDKLILDYCKGNFEFGRYDNACTAVINDADVGRLEVAGKGDVTINGGTFDEVINNIFYKKGGTTPLATGKLLINGGCFKSDTIKIEYANHFLENGLKYEYKPLSDYVAPDFALVASTTKPGYFEVVSKASLKAEVSTGAPDVVTEIPQTATKEETKLIEDAAKKITTTEVTGGNINTELNTMANNNTEKPETHIDALKAAVSDQDKENVTQNNVKIAVEFYMDIKIKDANADASAPKSLTVDIKPMVQKYATIADVANDAEIVSPEKSQKDPTKVVNAVKVGQPTELNVTQPVEIKLPLPQGFATIGSTVNIQHTHSKTGKIYIYTTTVQGTEDAPYIQFTNPNGFSIFLVGAADPVASINGIGYTSMQDAVNEVQNGQTIKLEKGYGTATEKDKTATVSKSVDFNINPNTNTFDATTIKAGGFTEVVYDSLTNSFKCVYTPISTGPTVYSISIDNVINGTIKASATGAILGDVVDLTVLPNEGYMLKNIKVSFLGNMSREIKDLGNGKMQFTMPSADVIVSAEFVEIPKPCTGLKDCPMYRFKDTDKDMWYHKSLDYVISKGIMNGVASDKFNPDGKLTRAMLMTMIARFNGVDTNGGSTWYQKGLDWAVANKISDGTNPEKEITREQAVTMLYRYLQSKGGGYKGAWMFKLNYKDAENVSEWAYEAMCYMTSNGIIEGVGENTLNPKGTATRAQIAAMVMRFLEMK